MGVGLGGGIKHWSIAGWADLNLNRFDGVCAACTGGVRGWGDSKVLKGGSGG